MPAAFPPEPWNEAIVAYLSRTVSETALPSAKTLRRKFAGTAELLEGLTDGFQATLKISLTVLVSLGDDELRARLQSLASVRLFVVGQPIRQTFAALLNGGSPKSCTIFSSPSEKFFICPTADAAIDILYPIWPKAGGRDLLTTVFVQEFSEARKGAGLTDTPKCILTLQGKKPPIDLSTQQKTHLGDFSGPFISLTLQQSHLHDQKNWDSLIWSLLTFYNYFSYHARSFKAALHSRMRKDADELVAAMQAVQVKAAGTQKLV